MSDYRYVAEQDKSYLEVSLTDYNLISNPVLNKGMAFSAEERAAFHLDGLLPPHFANIRQQRERSYEAFLSKDSDLEKYIYLRDLQNSNETLFYSLLIRHIEEMLPIVYTPTVGLGCQKFSETYRRPRGLFISYKNKDIIDKMFEHPRFDDIEVIVVSDGERILGLGDQGAGGMGIPIGKLSLYTACAGVHPSKTLPILLDTGTNNEDHVQNPLYIGWRHERIRGKKYDNFIESFVSAIKKRFPNVLLQWEDFAQQNANPILQKYRDQLCTFNDDIQGTAAVATGTMLSALNVTGKKLSENIIVVYGGGSAGCGISNLLVEAMKDEGLSEQEALKRFFVVDRNGLLLADNGEVLPFQAKFCQSRAAIAHWSCANPNNISLADVIKHSHATALIGVSGQANHFTQDIVTTMAAHTEYPIILPLSNPTDKSEATPADLVKWTHDKVLVGTGSPFADLTRHGKLTRIDQTNNSYIFPGMGLGIIAVKARRVSDKMFMVAAKALAACSPCIEDKTANLLPPMADIRKVSYQIAVAVAKEAVASQLAPYLSDAQIAETVQANIWEPVYLPYKRMGSTS